jgi:cysteinyl-tRNA synthetase
MDMPIKLYNTASRKKEEFRPLRDGKVGIYVCGVTVYDLCHVGHARSCIVFDVLVRYLRARGLDVTYVRNITDVDDKIIERAQKTERDTASLAQEYIDAFYEDMGRLGIQKADVEPRATEHIENMIDMITTLLDKEFAYVEGNDVYFTVDKFEDYGKLSRRQLDDMQAGSRIAVDDRKRHPMDFVLWKGAKPGEPQWQSPWGPGRPGWHIECSAMSSLYLGSTFDIHGGGQDLLFPHHENERAQSMAAHDKEFARYWIHNGFVTVESEKMSKSLGNFLTIRDALKRYHPEVLRLFLLTKHYRSPLDFSEKDVLDVQSGLARIYRTLQRLETVGGEYQRDMYTPGQGFLSGEQKDTFLEQYVHFMDDDLNTVGAIGLIFEKVKEMNRVLDLHGDRLDDVSLNQLKNDRHNLFIATRVLGLLEENPEDFFRKLSKSSESTDVGEVERMIQERSRARAEKDWAQADALRDRLQEMGIVLEDGAQGTTWRFDV